MVGATGLRCPECGHVARSSNDFYRTRRRWRWASLGLVTVLAAAGYPWGARYWDKLLLLIPQWQLLEERQLGAYTVQIFGDRRGWGRPMQGRVLRDGRREFTVTEWRITIGADNEDGSPPIGVADDMTGDSVPELILETHSGGAHCCRTYYILRLDPIDELTLLGTIDALESPASFKDLDGDGRLEVVLRDWTLYLTGVALGGISPAPEVILRYSDGRYEVAPDLMSEPAPTEDELLTAARRVRDGAEGDGWDDAVPVAYWGTILDLVYSGHETLAWRFADLAWPESRAGKDGFLAHFRQELGESRYLSAIRGTKQP